MKNDSLCQSFHFLLRSFSSTIVKKKIDDVGTFAPIKILTSAHILLRNSLLDADAKGIPSVSSYESQIHAGSRESIDGFGSLDSNDSDTKKKRGKRFGKLFRRAGRKAGSKEDKGKIDQGLESTEDSQRGRKNNNFVPNSILRKSADQNPHHDSMYHDHNERTLTNSPTTAALFENMGWFLSNLDQLCGQIEDALLKSYSQKITEWALQPWNASKDRALSNGIADMRNGLNVINLLGRSRSNESDKKWSPVINPVNPAETLDSIIPEESYILPSAHFPLLLAFNSSERTDISRGRSKSDRNAKSNNDVRLYRTTVKINLVRGNESRSKNSNKNKSGSAYVVHAAVGGEIKETGKRSVELFFVQSLLFLVQ